MEQDERSFDNPTYDTAVSPIATSLYDQQTAPLELEANVNSGGKDSAGYLYNVLEGPSLVENKLCQLHGREDNGRDCGIIWEDMMELSSAVPIIILNAMEEVEQKGDQDYSMIYESSVGQ